MIYDINELDDRAQRMKVCWDKANNFYNTFAGDFLETAKALQSGRYGNDWTVAKWLFIKIGVWEKSVLALLKAHQNTLAGEQREMIEAAKKEQQRKNAEERQAKRLAAAQAKARRAAEKAQEQQAKVVAEAQAKALREADQQAREEQKKLAEAEQKRTRKNANSRKNYAQRRKTALAASQTAAKATTEQAMIAVVHSANPRAAILLKECVEIERTNRIELGCRYAELQQLCSDKQLGVNPETGKPWFWGAWCKENIKRSRRDIARCILEFLGHNVPKNSEPENVVPFAFPKQALL